MSIEVIRVQDLEEAAMPLTLAQATDPAGGAANLQTLWHGRTLRSIPLSEIEAIKDLTQRPALAAVAIATAGTSFAPRTSSSSSDEDDEEDF